MLYPLSYGRVKLLVRSDPGAASCEGVAEGCGRRGADNGGYTVLVERGSSLGCGTSEAGS
jgi:hypothetical protein